MFWIRSGLQGISISGRLTAAPAAPAEDPVLLEDVRQAMLDMLGEGGSGRWKGLSVRIRVAMSARALWDLRPELMTAISHLQGEAHARRRLDRVTAMFEGLLPAASRRRPRSAPASGPTRR